LFKYTRKKLKMYIRPGLESRDSRWRLISLWRIKASSQYVYKNPIAQSKGVTKLLF